MQTGQEKVMDDGRKRRAGAEWTRRHSEHCRLLVAGQPTFSTLRRKTLIKCSGTDMLLDRVSTKLLLFMFLCKFCPRRGGGGGNIAPRMSFLKSGRAENFRKRQADRTDADEPKLVVNSVTLVKTNLLHQSSEK